MGFMDKVKTQASQLAEKAQESAKAGQDKLSSMQSKKQSDALLLELGGITYLTQAGRAQPGSDARANELVSQIAAFEAANGAIAVTPATPPPGETGGFVPGGGETAAGTAAAPGEAASVPGGVVTPGTFGGIPSSGGIPVSESVGGIPTSSGIPTSEPVGGIPASGGIPTAEPAGGIPASGGIPTGSSMTEESSGEAADLS